MAPGIREGLRERKYLKGKSVTEGHVDVNVTFQGIFAVW